jgi:endo-1,4-beta-xylanase
MPTPPTAGARHRAPRPAPGRTSGRSTNRSGHATSTRTLRIGLVSAAACLVAAGVFAIPAQAASSLKDLATADGKDIGFALDPGKLSESAYKSIADNEFNLVVPENAMKWDTVESSQGSFNFGPGDQVVAYAQQTGKKVYAHNLVWHSQLPGWVQNLDATAMKAAMENHITKEATHFAGKVVAWDVVNEAFDDNGTRRASSPFQQKLGDGYIEDAFRTARAADPTAKLCYNDYNIENVGAKSNAVYAMVKDFKARGVPIDCVGFQSHFIVGQVPGDMQTNLQRFADLGVDVRITELDIRMQTPASQQNLTQQAADYKKVFQNCLAVTRCQGVTIWGITDKYSWVPNTFSGQGAALVWDDNYAKKPAYDAIAQALGGTVVTPPPTSSTPTQTPTTPVTPTQTPTQSPTQPPSNAACKVHYQVSSWNTGFTANLTITNTSASAVNGWTLRFTFPSGQTITQAWSSKASQSGSSVALTNESWNGSLAAGGSTVIGFNGAYSGTNTNPTSYSLNGTACSLG